MRHSPIPSSLTGPAKLRNSSCEISGKDDTFSISALHIAIKVPYFSNSWHKNEKVTPLTAVTIDVDPVEHLLQILVGYLLRACQRHLPDDLLGLIIGNNWDQLGIIGINWEGLIGRD
eukprot:SAG31_NODE_187_length_20848_cov_22.521953_10_plen_117_part_00